MISLLLAASATLSPLAADIANAYVLGHCNHYVNGAEVRQEIEDKEPKEYVDLVLQSYWTGVKDNMKNNLSRQQCVKALNRAKIIEVID